MDTTLLPGFFAVAVSDSATEIVYRKSSAYYQALAVSIGGGIITAAFLYLIQSAEKRALTIEKKVVVSIMTTIAVFISSEFMHANRKRLSLILRSVLVGLIGGIVWYLTSEYIPNKPPWTPEE